MRDKEIQQQMRLSPSPRAALQDCLFIGFTILLSLILYIRGLGFYSDDWSFLGYLSTSANQSLAGFFQTLYDFENIKSRPVQALYQAGLYRLFGFHPLGYHLVNAGVLLAGIILFYYHSYRDW